MIGIYRYGIVSPEVKKINKIYNHVQDKIDEDLIETFKLNDPLSVYTLFQYLINNNYLTNDDEFKDLDDIVNDQLYLGALTLTGKGICRHKSTMIKDLFEKKGYSADIMVGKVLNNSVDVMRRFNSSHHAIVKLNHENFSYYLDPQAKVFYDTNLKLCKSKQGIKFINKRNFTSEDLIKILFNYKDWDLQKTNIKLLEEKTRENNKIFDDNKDIFIKFKKDNDMCYSDVKMLIK